MVLKEEINSKIEKKKAQASATQKSSNNEVAKSESRKLSKNDNCAFASLREKIKGSTLIESLTALAIVTAVMGSAFTVYNQTVSKQSHVMKVRAKFIQTAFEQNVLTEKISEDLSDEFTTVETEEIDYKNLSDVKQYTLIIKNKAGKQLLKKNYLKYTPK